MDGQAPKPEDRLLSDKDLRSLVVRLKGFAQPDAKRSAAQLLATVLPFAALWLAMWFSLDFGYWMTLLLAVPAAAFLVRLFIIQHDCGHGAFFASRFANNVLGRIIGVLTLTPYDYWRRAHAIHHASMGNLDRRGIGDVSTLTIREYRAMSRWNRFRYRVYRHPLTLFVFGPAYLFIIKQRLPLELPFHKNRNWLSILATDIAIVAAIAAVAAIVGPVAFLKVQLPITWMAASIGVWLFFVQHQFDSPYWRRQKDWDFHQAAMLGSSYYALPGLLRWITGNIGLHHIHHLNSRIPNYRLPECLDRVPELHQVKRLSILDSLRCAGLALSDEGRGKMIRFRELIAE